MKKTRLSIALILVVLMSVALMVSGCGNKEADTQPTMAPTQAPTEAPTPEPAPAGVSGEFSFGGSTTVGKFMDAMIEAFQAANPESTVSYEGTGSSSGIAALQDGTVSMAGASRGLKDAEKDAGCVATPVAMDGIAIIANNSVAVDDLTVEQLADIFTGVVTDWSEVIDGASGEIVVVNRDSASGTRATFMELVLEEVYEEPEFTTNAMETDSNGNMVEMVNTTPNAIGYCGIGYLSELTDSKAVSVAGVTPSMETVMDGSYSISRYLFFVTMGDPADGTGEKTFIDFCLAEEGQNIIEDVGGYIKLP